MQRSVSISLTSVILLVACSFCLSQDELVVPPRSARLPRVFAEFTTSEVLSKIFRDYDPATGRVSSILNDERKSALVRIKKAKLWKARGEANLVALVELAAYDEQFVEKQGLCGGCAAYVILTVLKKKGDTIELVAKQATPASSAMSDEEPSELEKDIPPDPCGPLMYSGHSELALDLAPYRLNARETLLGVREEHIWMGSYSTTLFLYRIEEERLKEVFNEVVIDREYPDKGRPIGQTVLKTVSVVSTVPLARKFYTLLINRTTFRCADKDDDGDCNARDGVARRVRSWKELWQFDGTKFNKE